MEIITRKEAIAQGLKFYFTGKECRQGHVSKRRSGNGGCEVCAGDYREENKEAIAEKRKAYLEKNKEVIAKKMKAYNVSYNEANKEVIAVKKKAYKEANKEVIAKKMKAYNEANKEARTKYIKEYNLANPLAQFARCTLRRIEGGLEDSERTVHYESELGYTQAEFRAHIENQFQEGMSWDRRNEFHIDHIKPLSLFLKEGVTDIKIINALSNLQPLWAKDNLTKGSTY
jgi:hypothetical protein